MRKLIMIGVAVLISGSFGSAQTLISSAGGTGTVGNYEISWSVGETVTQTISNGDITLTQGFHQAWGMVTPVENLSNLKLQLEIFPNPVKELLRVRMNIPNSSYNYTIYDLKGQAITNGVVSDSENEIDFSAISTGTYMINFVSEDESGSYKIIKD